MRKAERIKDYLLMEDEYIKTQIANKKPESAKDEEEKNAIDLIRGR